MNISGSRGWYLGVLLFLGLMAEATPVPGPLPSGTVEILPEKPSTGRLTASLTPSEQPSASIPETAQLVVSPMASDRGEDGEEEYRQTCLVEGERVLCTLSAGRFDLCFEISGFQRSCFWGVEIEAEGLQDLGKIPRTHGARLGGWLETLWPGLPLEGTVIELSPSRTAAPEDSLDRRRHRLEVRRAKSDPKGRFEFLGVSPGSYQLLAIRKGFYSQPLVIRVEPQVEAFEIPESVLLTPPSELEIRVEPPLDPLERPWRFRLLEPDGAPERMAEIAAGRSDEVGTWLPESLEPGPYSLEIMGSQDALWHQEDIELLPGPTHRFIAIENIPIEGRLTLGDEGVAAEIIFGTTEGMNRFPVNSNEDGKFTGFLPREGVWPLELNLEGPLRALQAMEPLEVRKRPGKRAAWIDIELPDTRLRGRVVGADGESVQAFVVGRREPREIPGLPPSRRTITLETATDGTFELLGVPPGAMELQAYDRLATSEWHQISLQEGIEVPEVLFQLRARRTLPGQLIGPGGPVAGARLIARPSHGSARALATRVDGSFEVSLEAAARYVDFLILPPSAGFSLQRFVPTSEGQPAVLSLPEGRGNLLLPAPHQAGSLQYSGVEFSFHQILPELMAAGRVQGHLGQSVLLEGAVPGLWSFCPRDLDESHCVAESLSAGGEVYLLPTAPPEPTIVTDPGEDP